MGEHDHHPAAPRHFQAEALEALDAEGRLDLVGPKRHRTRADSTQ